MNLQDTNRFIDLENVLKVSRVEGWGEGLLESVGERCTHCYILKWVTNKVLLYCTGNSAQCYMAA